MVPLGLIQYQTPGGARMAPNLVVPIWHLRRQRPNVAKVTPNHVVPIRRIRRQRLGDAKMAFAITRLTTSKTGPIWHLTSFVSY